MKDSWGDGWAGAKAIVSKGSTVVRTIAGITSGSAGTADLCGLSNGCYSFNVGGGSYDSEISWSFMQGASNMEGTGKQTKQYCVTGSSVAYGCSNCAAGSALGESFAAPSNLQGAGVVNKVHAGRRAVTDAALRVATSSSTSAADKKNEKEWGPAFQKAFKDHPLNKIIKYVNGGLSVGTPKWYASPYCKGLCACEHKTHGYLDFRGSWGNFKTAGSMPMQCASGHAPCAANEAQNRAGCVKYYHRMVAQEKRDKLYKLTRRRRTNFFFIRFSPSQPNGGRNTMNFVRSMPWVPSKPSRGSRRRKSR